MPNPTSWKGRMGSMSKKSASFHGRNAPPAGQPAAAVLLRPKTESDLLSGRRKLSGGQLEKPPQLTKLLLNVTIQRSLGALHVVMSSEATVGDLIAAAVRMYVKEGRRPLLATADASKFDLHYSSFSLESLDRDEKLITLGSRNFFMCPTKTTTAAAATTTGATVNSISSSAMASSSSCSREAEKVPKNNLHPWSRFLEFFT